ncbi:hypothetical protein, partial [Vibrio splendidus]
MKELKTNTLLLIRINEKVTFRTFCFLLLMKVLVAHLVIGLGRDSLEESEPGFFTNALYYCLDLYVLLLFIFLTFKKGLITYIKSLIILLFSLSISCLLNETSFIFHITYYIRIINPILCIWIFCVYFEPVEIRKVSKPIIFLCVLFLFVTIILGEPSYNRFHEWWPAYIGGIHTTAYFVGMLGLWVSVALLMKKKYLLAFFLVIFLILLISYGWGVRSANLMVTSSLSLYLISTLKVRYRMPIIAMLIVLSFVFLPWLLGFSLDDFSSGRLSMYLAKGQQISDRHFLEQLFGSGSGSDLIETDVWWGLKGAHNDYITWFVEAGLIGSLCFLTFLFLFYKNI